MSSIRLEFLTNESAFAISASVASYLTSRIHATTYEGHQQLIDLSECSADPLQMTRNLFEKLQCSSIKASANDPNGLLRFACSTDKVARAMNESIRQYKRKDRDVQDDREVSEERG
jgi:hypothetical protein